MFRPLEIYAAAPSLTVDTGIYSAGDVLFVPTKIANAALSGKGFSYLRQLLIMDADNQKAALDLLFFNEDPGSLGALNAALNISTAQMAKLIGMVSVAQADYTTLKANTNAMAVKSPGTLPLSTIATSKDIWVAGVSRGTPTYTVASSLVMKFMLERY